MVNIKKIIAVFLSLTFLFSQQYNNNVLAESVKTVEKVNYNDLVSYICFDECDYDTMKKVESYFIYVYECDLLDSHDANELLYFYKLEAIEDIDSINDVKNVEELAYYLMLDELANDNSVNNLTSLQNPDGGFGLAKNYESDILDTKVAAKALQYLGKTDEMYAAVQYIASCQNSDGGFGYQPGLESNAELTADIANVFADCVGEEQGLKNNIDENLSKLRTYLDDNAVALTDLDSNDLPKVYQHFNTALFKLKMDGEYDVTDYVNLQAEDGSVFSDSLATAMFLELIVREHNTIKASINNIVFTNDNGDKAS